MKPPEVLRQLKELREVWHKQSFELSDAQQQQYDKLIALRRSRVQELYKTCMVHKPGSK